MDRAHDIFRTAKRQPLDAIFAPASVAVIGATDRPESAGCAVLKNLGAFGGKVYPINPKRAEVLGKKAFPNIAALPEGRTSRSL